jgi:ferrous-iron efflux pump FieF
VTGTAEGEERTKLVSRAAVASITLALFLLMTKGWAAAETGSTAMLASLADTALDLIASLAAFAGIRIAALPADHDHRFGHGKAEALVALAQVVLITVSAIGIGWRAVHRMMEGSVTTDLELGIGVSLLAILCTASLLAYQRRVIARTGSVAIRTDSIHYQSDMLLNSAVIAALLLDQVAGIRGADAGLGILIAAWLLFNAIRASTHAVDQLMDKEWPDDLRLRFLRAAADYPELAGLHDLRTRSSGTHHFAQFHVWVPADWTVREAHDRMDLVEAQLQRRFPGTEFLIHLDPEGHIDRETLLPSSITESAS